MVAIVGGVLAVIALVVAGSPGDVVGDAGIVAGAAFVAVLLYASAELAWAWLQAPMRLLTADVAAIRGRLDATGPTSPAPTELTRADVRLEILELGRKGQTLLGYHSGAPKLEMDAWAAEASAFLRGHAEPEDAERFIAAAIVGQETLTIERQVQALSEVADRYRTPGSA